MSLYYACQIHYFQNSYKFTVNHLPQVCQAEPAEEEKEETPTKSKRLHKKREETFVQIKIVTTCDLFQLVCSPWSQAVVLSHGETWLYHLGKVSFTLTRCFLFNIFDPGHIY